MENSFTHQKYTKVVLTFIMLKYVYIMNYPIKTITITFARGFITKLSS